MQRIHQAEAESLRLSVLCPGFGRFWTDRRQLGNNRGNIEISGLVPGKAVVGACFRLPAQHCKPCGGFTYWESNEWKTCPSDRE